MCAGGADDTRKPLNADTAYAHRDESLVFAQILDQLCRVFELGLGAALVVSSNVTAFAWAQYSFSISFSNALCAPARHPIQKL